MTAKQLKEYCEAEFENIDTVIDNLFSVVNPAKPKYSTPELAAIAAFIHNCYNGMENILKRILAFKQIETKDSPTWHKDLLKISSDLGIVGDDLYTSLSNYLSFRHFFVHAYVLSLKWEELKPLVDDLKKTLEEFKSVIYGYIEMQK